jgi:DNA-binding transcriptional regulator YiaG/uncharacterized phage-associated protein
MKSPITGNEMKLKKRDDVIVFRKESFPIVYHYYHDEESNMEFTDDKLGDLNLNQAYNQYRAKYNLPFPDEIKEIRDQYSLNQNKMAEVLGFGINVYRQYENGEIPSISNARLIQMIKDPAEFRKLLNTSRVLPSNQLIQVDKRINSLIEATEDFSINGLPQYLMTGNGDSTAGVYTGYKIPNLKKLIEMIVYFTDQVKPWKTKLNKLLFYADFHHYKTTGFSISGTEYYAIPMGPVPNNFSSIFEYAARHDHIDVTYQEFNTGGIGESFTPHTGRTFNDELFNKEELETLDRVIKVLGKKSTSEIIALSHDELAWTENIGGKSKIKYDYAFDLTHL